MKKSQAAESNCYSWYDTSPPLPYIVALPDFIKKQETYPLATHDRHDQVRGLRYVRLPNRGMGYSFLFKRLAAIPKNVRWEPALSAPLRTNRGSLRLNRTRAFNTGIAISSLFPSAINHSHCGDFLLQR
jgi:hypothetical protein